MSLRDNTISIIAELETLSPSEDGNKKIYNSTKDCDTSSNELKKIQNLHFVSDKQWWRKLEKNLIKGKLDKIGRHVQMTWAPKFGL